MLTPVVDLKRISFWGFGISEKAEDLIFELTI